MGQQIDCNLLLALDYSYCVAIYDSLHITKLNPPTFLYGVHDKRAANSFFSLSFT